MYELLYIYDFISCTCAPNKKDEKKMHCGLFYDSRRIRVGKKRKRKKKTHTHIVCTCPPFYGVYIEEWEEVGKLISFGPYAPKKKVSQKSVKLGVNDVCMITNRL